MSPVPAQTWPLSLPPLQATLQRELQDLRAAASPAKSPVKGKALSGSKPGAGDDAAAAELRLLELRRAKDAAESAAVRPPAARPRPARVALSSAALARGEPRRRRPAVHAAQRSVGRLATAPLRSAAPRPLRRRRR